MPVGTYAGANSYTGNGVTTSFAYSFRVLDDADILVTVDGVTKALTTDYTVDGVGEANGGDVIFNSAPANASAIVISRNRAYTRETDYQRNGSFDEETVDADFDGIVMLIQQLYADRIRSFKAPVSVTSDQVLTAAQWAARASKLLGWDASGNLGVFGAADFDTVVASAFILTLLDDANAAAARTTLDVPSNSEAILKSLIDAKGDLIYGSAADTPAVLANGIEMIGAAPGGRLTLTSGTPVTTGDVTAATTVYYTPHLGNIVSLYDGDTWIPYIFAELSQATSDTTKSPAAVANNSNYDVFVWNDSGTLRATRGPAWTSDTARGTGAGTTELELFEGRYVNKVAITNGPTARRGVYVGTIRSDGSAQINDSLAKRHVWNTYNRRNRPMKVLEATSSWTYSTATWRQANNSAANQLDFVRGLNEDAVRAEVSQIGYSDSGVNICTNGIGLDSTSANGATRNHRIWSNATYGLLATSAYEGFPGLGRHYLAWLEYGAGSNTNTWTGSESGDNAGITGEVFA